MFPSLLSETHCSSVIWRDADNTDSYFSKEIEFNSDCTREFFIICRCRYRTPSTSISLKLPSPNYSLLWPWEGSWLTHWVLSNGFDPLLWPRPSVSVGVVMREKRPLVSPPIPSLGPWACAWALDNSNLVSAFHTFDLGALSLLMLA